MNNFGSRLKMLRTEKGYSLSNLANAANINITEYSRIEEGELIPQQRRFDSIAEALKLSEAERQSLLEDLSVDIIMREIHGISAREYLYPQETKTLFQSMFDNMKVICPLVTNLVQQKLVRDAHQLGFFDSKHDYGFFSEKLVNNCIERCMKSLKNKIGLYSLENLPN